jgi:hypothetical protein
MWTDMSRASKKKVQKMGLSQGYWILQLLKLATLPAIKLFNMRCLVVPKLRKATVGLVMSVRMELGVPLDGFSRNLILENFSKIC